MAAISPTAVKSALTRVLKLRQPRFELKRYGPMLSGSVISESFRGQGDLKRQTSIRDALDATFGAEGARRIGTILAYTPEEWDVDLEATVAKRKSAVG